MFRFLLYWRQSTVSLDYMPEAGPVYYWDSIKGIDRRTVYFSIVWPEANTCKRERSIDY